MTHSASQSSARRRACLNLLALLLVFAVTTLACNVRRASAATRAPITVADFEAESYGDWRVTGDAFGDKPASATVPGGMGPVFNHKGAQLVNTYASPMRDAATGTLESPEFTIERSCIVFYIGGGAFPGETGVDLFVGDAQVASATGLFAVSRQGHEGLEKRVWDVSQYEGQKARIVIYDKKAGGDWGHIKLDHIVQCDSAEDVFPLNTLAIAPTFKTLEYDRMIFGQFIEHFHRQIYGGIFEPGSPLADERGYRVDVLDALRELRIPIVRWPGGCFVSAYHWLDGVGPDREPTWDKAWHVEDPNTFGTAEYVQWCRLIGAEPYICTNAGTGTIEEMSDWVEYCNLSVGKYGRMRQRHGYEEPFNVKYWSIGNENWGGHEMGAKTVAEWGPLVREAEKLMQNTDANIELFAAALPYENWTIPLLQTAGRYLNYVSIHGYWDASQTAPPAPYLECMMRTDAPEKDIARTINMLDQTGYRGRVKIAFDEWNLRGWRHPGIGDPKHLDIPARAENDNNKTYTMADAVFSACFLNTCLRHCEDVKIACFSPIVNARGALYVYPEGIVKRTTFYVFKLYSDLLERNYVPIEFDSDLLEFKGRATQRADVVLTCNDARDHFVAALVNKDPEQTTAIALKYGEQTLRDGELRANVLRGSSPDDYNDVGRENSVVPEEIALSVKDGKVIVPPHAIAIISFDASAFAPEK